MNPEVERLLDELIADLDEDPALDVEARLAGHPEHAARIREELSTLLRFGLVSVQRPGRSLERIAARFRLELAPLRPAPAGSGVAPAAAIDGRFDVLEPIGRGAMGSVFRAWDRDLEREVALKVTVPPTAAPDEWVRRFATEARIHGRLEHPGIAPVHELGLTEDGRLWLAMKLIRGRNLREVIQALEDRKPRAVQAYTLGRRVEMMMRVCEALAYAHESGVIHRDLKPANVLVGSFGEVQLVDWGLSRAAETAESGELSEVSPGSEDRTASGQVIGTPSYLSPEQARGDLDRVGVRTDVFGAGALLHHLVAGVPPYRGEDLAEVLDRARAGHRNDPRLVDAPWPVPRELRAVCSRALAAKPEERYASVRELSDDLRAFLDGRTGRAWRDGPLTRTSKWVRHHPAAAAALTAVLGLVAVGTLAANRVEAAARERRERIEAEHRTQRRKFVEEMHARALRFRNWTGGTINTYEQVRGSLQTVAAFGVRLEDPSAGIDLTALARENETAHRDLLNSFHTASIDFVQSGAALAHLTNEGRADDALALWSGLAESPEGWAELDPSVPSAWPAWVRCVELLEHDPWRRELWSAWTAAAEGRPEVLLDRLASLVEEVRTQRCTRSGLDLQWAGQLARVLATSEWQDLFDAALERDPSLFWANLLMGNSLGPDYDTDDARRRALAYFHQALGSEPEAPQTYTNLTLAYRFHDPDLGRRYGLRAVEMAPDNPRTHLNLGLVEWAAGWKAREPELARAAYLRSAEALAEASRLDPGDVDKRWMHGRSLVYAEDPRGREIIEQLVLDEPGYANGWFELGQIHWTDEPRDLGAFSAAWREYLRTGGERPGVRLELARRLDEQGWPERAAVVIGEGLAKGWQPEESAAWLARLPRSVELATGRSEPRSDEERLRVLSYSERRDTPRRTVHCLRRWGLETCEGIAATLSDDADREALLLFGVRAAARLSQRAGWSFEDDTAWIDDGDVERAHDLPELSHTTILGWSDRTPLWSTADERVRASRLVVQLLGCLDEPELVPRERVSSLLGTALATEEVAATLAENDRLLHWLERLERLEPETGQELASRWREAGLLR